LVDWWIGCLVDWWIGGLVDWWIGGLVVWGIGMFDHSAAATPAKESIGDKNVVMAKW
jgi:hypothetical protein